MNAAGWTISVIAIVTALVVAFRWERASRRDASDRSATGEREDARPGRPGR